MNLFGFHHAGGGTSAFSGWQKALAGRAEVIPVRLPGREVDSPAHRDIADLAVALNTVLAGRLDQPHVFYGHSMGALVAYHLTRLRVALGHPPPRRLIVGAARAPHLPPVADRVGRLPDEQLAQWLLDLSGLPERLLGAGPRRERQVALLRADLRVCASHRRETPFRPLPCPVDAMVGAADPLVAVADAAAWSEHSAPGGTLHVLPGGHFFGRAAKDQFFARINSLLDLA